jgi:hypothetical protein
MIQPVFPQPPMSCRLNRSPNTTMSSQNQMTNAKMTSTSHRKLAKL